MCVVGASLYLTSQPSFSQHKDGVDAAPYGAIHVFALRNEARLKYYKHNFLSKCTAPAVESKSTWQLA